MLRFLSKTFRIGIIGGGQLGKMLIENGIFYRSEFAQSHVEIIEIYVLDPSFDCPCAKLCCLPKDHPRYDENITVHLVQGSLQDAETLEKFCKDCDVVTFEIEHVNTEALCKLEDAGQRFVPSPKVLQTIQNKLTQKIHYIKHDLPIVPHAIVELSNRKPSDLQRIFRIQYEYKSFSREALDTHFELVNDELSKKTLAQLYSNLNNPVEFLKPPPTTNDDVAVVFKKIRGGYDGHGVLILKNSDENCTKNFDNFCGNEVQILAEDYIENRTEISVLVARTRVRTSYNTDTDEYDYAIKTITWPVVEMVFNNENNILDYCFSPSKLSMDVQQSAVDIAIKAIESFDDNLHKNSIAEGVFAVEMFVDSDNNIFINEIAPRPHNSCHHTIHACEDNESVYEILAQILFDNLPQSMPSLINAKSCAMKNILGPQEWSGLYRFDRDSTNHFGHSVNTILYQKTTTKPQRKLGHMTCIDNSGGTTADLAKISLLSTFKEYQVKPAYTKKIGIIMGSTSDYTVMALASDFIKYFNNTILRKYCCKTRSNPNGICDINFEATFECTVVSAHRTPNRLVEYAKTAADRGIGVIIAGAGGAAHLPGMIASITHLPVIGVPVKSPSSVNGISGLDSMYSIVQMPPGVPVATVAINGAKNAAILALQILGVSNDVIAKGLQMYKETLGDSVIENSFFLEK